MAKIVYQVTDSTLKVTNDTLRVANNALLATHKALQIVSDEQVETNEALKASNNGLRVANDALLTINGNLQKVLSEFKLQVRTLTGLLPICTSCGKIRYINGEWLPINEYVTKHVTAEISYDICPSCASAHKPDNDIKKDGQS